MVFVVVSANRFQQTCRVLVFLWDSDFDSGTKNLGTLTPTLGFIV